MKKMMKNMNNFNGNSIKITNEGIYCGLFQISDHVPFVDTLA